MNNTLLDILRKTAGRCLIVLGIAVLLAVIFAIAQFEWRPHFFHLIDRTWQAFKNAEGSSTAGILSTAMYPFFIVGITLFFIWQGRGWRVVMEHWEREIWTAVRVTIIVSLIIYGPVFIWQLVKTTYADHASLVQAINGKAVEINRLTHSQVTAQVSGVSIGHYGNDPSAGAFVVLMIEEQNRLGLPTSLTNWVVDLQTPSGIIPDEVPLIPSAEVHMHLEGRPGTITITPAHYCPIATATPLATGEGRECWIWVLFRHVAPDSLYSDQDTFVVTFKDVATDSEHKAYRKVDFPKELYLPGLIPHTHSQ
jgi:hypothetical protein